MIIEVNKTEDEQFPIHIIFDDGNGRLLTIKAARELIRKLRDITQRYT